ncbi:MAG: DUF2250 domain-containing protein [Firmicutes bacterium]|nr:DUF2250 domain-containing protein [Bacillota bacterium]
MPVFNARYLSDAEVWAKLEQVMEERHNVQRLLEDPEIYRDPGKIPGLARRLLELNQICHLVDELRGFLKDKQELEIMMSKDKHEDGLDEISALYEEITVECSTKSGAIIRRLIDNGYIDEEFEDETDLKILRFIDYAGPEYAWRLSINIGISWEESRRRLARLLEKGLLERVEGNMLGNYHREKSWTKHMNHTYYRISREGRLYLRRLRRREYE